MKSRREEREWSILGPEGNTGSSPVVGMAGARGEVPEARS